MKAEYSLDPSDFSPLTARRITPRLISVPALDVNILVPLMTQAFPSRLAAVRIARASDPASGSVRPNAPRRSPRAKGPSQRRFCSSVPK